jgi:anaerobic magnesium-protoporphyrin IX monomethyl ester cyclase
MSVVLTDYGCPFRCGFCVMPSLGFALRPLKDVLAELRHLQSLGVRELFFIDQTFGARRERTLALCAALAQPGWKFSWSCFSRTDVTTPELLQAMARAGCHTVIYGVESASAGLLKGLGKSQPAPALRRVLEDCRRAGLRTAATFMLGLPGENEAQTRQTIRLALDLPLDFASFNVAVPRAGTRWHAAALARGAASADLLAYDQTGQGRAWATPELDANRILALRREALRRFYLRPAYWLRRLLGLRSWVDARSQLADGWGVVKDALGAWGRKA